MNFDGQRYYRVNRFCLEMVGLWPYNNSIYIYIYRAFTIFVLVSSCITQFAKLQSTIYDFDRFLYNLTYSIPSLIYTLKFFSYIINIDRIKEMMNRIQHDWNTLKDKKECEIIRYYTIIGMRYTIVSCASYPFLFIFNLTFYLPGILDFIHPLNQSRSRKLPIILVEYYILDEQKYFYPILVHQSLLIILGISTIIAIDTLNAVYVHHACGLFEVASYRLKHVFDDGMFSVTENEKYAIIHARIVKAINMHTRTVEFLDYLLSTFNISFIITFMLGVISIITNMFRLIEAILAMNNFKELIGAAVFAAGLFSLLFFGSYFGQKVTDHSIIVFDKAYDVSWYVAPVHIQKLFVFILQRTVKGYVFKLNIFIMSMENFASIASMILSYLTIIYSVR